MLVFSHKFFSLEIWIHDKINIPNAVKWKHSTKKAGNKVRGVENSKHLTLFWFNHSTNEMKLAALSLFHGLES